MNIGLGSEEVREQAISRLWSLLESRDDEWRPILQSDMIYAARNLGYIERGEMIDPNVDKNNYFATCAYMTMFVLVAEGEEII